MFQVSRGRHYQSAMALALVQGPAAQVTVGLSTLNDPFRFHPVHESGEGGGLLRALPIVAQDSGDMTQPEPQSLEVEAQPTVREPAEGLSDCNHSSIVIQ